MFRGGFWTDWMWYFRLGWGFCDGGVKVEEEDLELVVKAVVRLVWGCLNESMYSHLVSSYISYHKNLIIKYKFKRKRKKNREMFKYLLFNLSRAAVFSHPLSLGLALNRRNLAATTFYET